MQGLTIRDIHQFGSSPEGRKRRQVPGPGPSTEEAAKSGLDQFGHGLPLSRSLLLEPGHDPGEAWLGLLMNEDVTGLGGDCYGDSGSPKLLRGGDGFTIYATVTLGDAVCRATSWDYRLDTPSARGFLGAFLDLP